MSTTGVFGRIQRLHEAGLVVRKKGTERTLMLTIEGERKAREYHDQYLR
jgi:Mn-dependent DtxR family transcriptional regulator